MQLRKFWFVINLFVFVLGFIIIITNGIFSEKARVFVSFMSLMLMTVGVMGLCADVINEHRRITRSRVK